MTSSQDRPDFITDIDGALIPEARKFLEEYTGLASAELISHIDASRQEAWAVFPYSCVGMLTWLKSYIVLNPAYEEILNRLKRGESLVDCACFYARDLRQLTYDGAPSEKLMGFDIEPAWFDLGYSFFRDRSYFSARFFQADAWDEQPDSELARLHGSVDVVWAAKFLHLYTRDVQKKLLARLAKLLKPNGLLAGSHNGLPEPQEITIHDTTVWLADDESFREMWEEMAQETGTLWDLKTNFIDLRTIGWMERKEEESEYEKRIGYNIQFAATMLSNT